MRAMLFAALFALVSFPAFAIQDCRSIDADLAGFEEAGGSIHEFLAGDEKARAVAFFNALPPQSDETFEIVFMGRFSNGLGALAFGNGGEICHRLAFPPDAFQTIVKMIKGRAI